MQDAIRQRDIEIEELNCLEKNNKEKNGELSVFQKITGAFKRNLIIPVRYFFNKNFYKRPQKVLVVRLGAIGDVVHTTNVYRSVKAIYPEVEFQYLSGFHTKDMVENDPDLTKIWTIDKNKIKFNSKFVKEYAQKLREENFDLAINLQPSLKTRYLLACAGIKQVKFKKDVKLHAVTNFWQTVKKAFLGVKPLDYTSITIDENICKKMAQELESYKRPLIILNAGGMHNPRQGRAYPAEKWVELGNKLQEKYDGTILIPGLDEDRDELSKLEQIKNSVSFIGKLSLLENSALIKNADLLISGDSGPLHIAMALGVKAVGLYGSMPVERSGPYGSCGRTVTSDYKCSPCTKRRCKLLKHSKELYAPCMAAIPVEKIMEVVDLEH